MLDRRFLRRLTRHLDARFAHEMRFLRERVSVAWFDYCHSHVDWYGKARRAPELAARYTFDVLRQADEVFAGRRDEVQVWAEFHPDTANNAVYLHSENPNGTPFPHPFPGVVWDGMPPHPQIGNDARYEFGRYITDSGEVHVCRLRFRIRDNETISSPPGT